MSVQARVKKLNLTIVVKKRRNFSPGSLWRWSVKANASSEGNEMNKLRRFYEKVPYGQTSSRAALVLLCIRQRVCDFVVRILLD